MPYPVDVQISTKREHPRCPDIHRPLRLSDDFPPTVIALFPPTDSDPGGKACGWRAGRNHVYNRPRCQLHAACHPRVPARAGRKEQGIARGLGPALRDVPEQRWHRREQGSQEGE